jgi:hypothetical protein
MIEALLFVFLVALAFGVGAQRAARMAFFWVIGVPILLGITIAFLSGFK